MVKEQLSIHAELNMYQRMGKSGYAKFVEIQLKKEKFPDCH